MLIEFFLCDRAFPSPVATSWLFFVLVIQTELNCPQHNVEALKKYVVMRGHFRDLILWKSNESMAKRRILS